MNKLMNLITKTQNLTLLYVEDNKHSVETSMLVFNDFFNNIILADNGKMGIEKFNSNDIDIIITDINMPVMGGLEMIEEIRKLDNEIPIIITSAYNEISYFQESIKLNIDVYLLKPIKLAELIGAFEKVILHINLKNENLKYLNLLKQYQEVIDEIASITKTDPEGIITYVNDSYSKISGYSKEELLGENHNIVRHEGNSKEFYKEMWNTIKNKKQIWKRIVRNITKNGDNYYAKTVIKPILDNNNNVIEYIALRDNITNLMAHKTQVHDLVSISEFPIVIFIKIDLFEEMEIYHGQNLIKDIEREFAKKIFKILPFDFNKVYILENGIFALVKDIKELNIDLNVFSKDLKVFQNILDKTSIEYQDIKYSLHSTISVSYGEDALENVRYGLKILKEKKQTFIVADNLVKQAQIEAQKRLKVLRTIKCAIKNSKVISYFQPIINNKTMEIDKYESLVRIIDENDNILMPLDFLQIAQKTNFYFQITLIVLNNSIRAIRKSKKNISMNISFLDIENDEMRNNILKILEQNKDICNKITFELLEDNDVGNLKMIKKFIIKIKSYGVKIAIDDFGKGYSNFERLINYQPDILKLDGLLIKDIDTNPLTLSIVEILIIFAKKHNMEIIAEYVRNESIFNVIKRLDIDYSQGFYLGKPEPLL